MSFLRLGTTCAIVSDERAVLLSQRGDLGVWNLPGGRLDAGERLADAAAREVYEETGLQIQIEHPLGLYYLSEWRRLNVLFIGRPVAGTLRQRTLEARANQFFPANRLPEPLLGAALVADAVANHNGITRQIVTSPNQLVRMRVQLAFRWARNWLMGRPEPRYVYFQVNAVGLIFDPAHRRLLTMAGDRERVLPFVTCDGRNAPWEQLNEGVQLHFEMVPRFRWVGVWQDIYSSTLEFVFAATVDLDMAPDGTEWTTARHAALLGRDAAYVANTRATYWQDPVWSIDQVDDALPFQITQE